MNQEQIKTLLVNIVTGGVIVAVLVVGYSVFVKKDSVVSEDSGVQSAETDARTTALVGIEIARTMRVLEDLTISVKDSMAVFDDFAFENLTDFSAEIPKESVGRGNPFLPTEWKIKLKALEEAASKGSTKESVGQEASVIRQIQIQDLEEIQDTFTQTSEQDLFGDIDPDSL